MVLEIKHWLQYQYGCIVFKHYCGITFEQTLAIKGHLCNNEAVLNLLENNINK
jgi:hypothetical protein